MPMCWTKTVEEIRKSLSPEDREIFDREEEKAELNTEMLELVLFWQGYIKDVELKKSAITQTKEK